MIQLYCKYDLLNILDLLDIIVVESTKNKKAYTITLVGACTSLTNKKYTMF